MLDVQRLRTKRRMLAALADVSGGSPQEVRALATRHRTITAELERLEGDRSAESSATEELGGAIGTCGLLLDQAGHERPRHGSLAVHYPGQREGQALRVHVFSR